MKKHSIDSLRLIDYDKFSKMVTFWTETFQYI